MYGNLTLQISLDYSDFCLFYIEGSRVLGQKSREILHWPMHLGLVQLEHDIG